MDRRRARGATGISILALIAGVALSTGASAADAETAEDREADSRACAGQVDPDCYLTISLEGRRQQPLLGPRLAPAEVWEVVPTRGSLEVSFDLDKMRERWGFDTEASLSMWARKIPRPDPNDGAGAAMEIGIPPYSSLVEGLQIRSLDLAAAGNLMNQLFQGARNAHRILGNESAAEIARLEAELAAYIALRDAHLKYLVAAERALTQLYTESLRFTLDVTHVELAAGILSAAEEALTEARRRTGEAALEAAANEVFFTRLESQRAAIDSWLKGLESADVKPYMPVISGLIERPVNVVEGVVASVKKLLASGAAKDADEAARSAARHGLVEIASQLVDIETDLHVVYRETDGFDKYENRRQYQDRQVTGFVQAEIEAPREFGRRLQEAWKAKEASVACGLGQDKGREHATLDPTTPSDDDDSTGASPESVEQVAKSQAQVRFEALEPLLRWIRGGALPAAISEEIQKRFSSQIRLLREPLIKIDARIEDLRGQLAEERHRAEQFDLAVEQCETQRDRVSTTIATLLMIDIMDRLIDQIVPGSLALDNVDLDPGDRLEILVSFSKAVVAGKLPPAQSYSFLASPFGWRAPFPYVADATSYAKPEGSNDYEFRPGLVAVWNYYGRAHKAKSVMRTLAPGFGIHAVALQFRDDEDADDEFGIGVGVTLFDNLLILGGGWNLQARQGDSRTYVAVGLSVRRAMEKFAQQ